MTDRIFEIEYNEDQKTTRKEYKDKKTGRRQMKTVQVKNPKCWQIVTTTGDTPLRPGMWLDERQLGVLRRGKKSIVRVGLPGQFRKNHRGY
tara:strand:+ start:1306 stop:1578 length:273 start_codon:yes stop_codon:yes gene_type:complete